MTFTHALRALGLLLLLCGAADGLRPVGGLRMHRGRSMRSRTARAAMAADDGGSDWTSVFKTNRDSPEARKNQLEWARAQMDMQVPGATLDGASIEDREDFVTQYIASEKEKFGRELTRDEAAAEVDEWLLAQATSASTNLDKSDVGLGAVVFLAVFAAGLYFAQQ